MEFALLLRPSVFLILTGLLLQVSSSDGRMHKYHCQCVANNNAYRVIGGSIINEFYVLSAAHCFWGIDLSGIQVGYEHTDLVEMDKWKTYRDIETVHWPKQYDGTKKSLDDIALAKIKTPFTFGITAMPACLPTAEYVSDYGEDLAITGFGFTEPPIYDKDNNLQNSAKKSRYLLVAYGQDYTSERNPSEDAFCDKDPAKVICVTNETEHMVDGQVTKFTDSSCKADSGGPLHFTNESDAKTIVIGVGLSGKGEWVDKEKGIRKACTKMQTYTRVSAHKDWILSIVGGRKFEDYCEVDD